MAKFKKEDIKELHVTLNNGKEFIFKDDGLKTFFRMTDDAVAAVPPGITPKAPHSTPYASYGLEYSKGKSAEELRREAEGMVKFDYH